MKCDICGKSSQFGHRVSHSKRRTNHRFLANIHPAKVLVGTEMKRLDICTRCLRTQNKAGKAA